MNLRSIEINNFYKKIPSGIEREFFKRVWQTPQKKYENISASQIIDSIPKVQSQLRDYL